MTINKTNTKYKIQFPLIIFDFLSQTQIIREWIFVVLDLLTALHNLILF